MLFTFLSALTATGAAAQTVSLTVCLSPGGIFGGATAAIFGYELRQQTALSASIGASNNISPGAANQGQLIALYPGFRPRAFRLPFDPTATNPTLTWNVQGQTAIADWSTPQCAEISVPDAPVIGTATLGSAGSGAVSVSFTPPVNDGESAIIDYTATCGVQSAIAAASPITVTALTNGTAVTCRVTARNSEGSSTASAASNSVIPTAPQAITFNNPGAQNFGSSPTLTATASSTLTPTFTSSSTGVCTITPSGNLSFITAGNCIINADQDGNAAFSPAPQVQHSFTVIAVVPGAPTIGLATAGNTQATVVFTPPASNGGSAIISYTATSNPSAITGTCAAPCAASAITVTGLTNGTAYTFTVRATNGIAPGAASAASNSVTPQVACTAGSFSATGFAPCAPASAGNYVPVAGSTSATPCAAGSYSPAASATSCTPAAIGFFVAAVGATTQIACPANTFTPSTGATACTLNPPPNITVSISGVATGATAAGGTASPLGVTQIGYNGSLDVLITANPRYVASLGGTCLGRIITSTAFVPQGAGNNIYRTDATGNDCIINVRFVAVNPTLTISGSAAITPPNATPAQTFTEVGKPATFIANLRGAIGVLNLNNPATNTPISPVFIGFQADGVAIVGCEAQAIAQVVMFEVSSFKATCTTSALTLGNKIITASFNGDNYNFPASTSTTATPTQALTHTVVAVGALPALPPVVVPPVLLPTPPILPPTTGANNLPNVPVNLPPLTLLLNPTLAPQAIRLAVSPSGIANGTVSPYASVASIDGTLEVANASAFDVTIVANPRYLARVSGSCGGAITTVTPLVPQGAGSNVFRTNPVIQACTVIITFTPALPNVTLSGSNTVTSVNATPVATFSTIDKPATFIATLRQAIGLVGLDNVSPSSVYIAFQADGMVIPGCEKQFIAQASTNDESRYQASCATAFLSLGTHKITASFSGDKFNFPVITDPNQTPTPVLTHTVVPAP